MKNTKMTWFQTAILNAIREHCADPDRAYLAKNMPIELITMISDNSNEMYTRYLVKTLQNADTFEDNVTIWNVYLYANGSCNISFSDSVYMTNKELEEFECAYDYI